MSISLDLSIDINVKVFSISFLIISKSTTLILSDRKDLTRLENL